VEAVNKIKHVASDFIDAYKRSYKSKDGVMSGLGAVAAMHGRHMKNNPYTYLAGTGAGAGAGYFLGGDETGGSYLGAGIGAVTGAGAGGLGKFMYSSWKRAGSNIKSSGNKPRYRAESDGSYTKL